MGSATKYQRTLFEPEHELFRESYRAFLDRHVAPYHDEWEKTKIVDRGVWLEAGKQGFLGMAVPEEYGGGVTRTSGTTRSSPRKPAPDGTAGSVLACTTTSWRRTCWRWPPKSRSGAGFPTSAPGN